MNESMATEFLLELYETSPQNEWINLWARDHEDNEKYGCWSMIADIPNVVEQAKYLPSSCDIWFGVATRKQRLINGARGGTPDCAHVPALWVDIDVAGPNHARSENLPPTMDAAYTLLSRWDTEPSAIIHTGGGLQAYWLLEEPLEVQEAVTILNEWGWTWSSLAAEFGWQVDSVFDVARILRLPGTTNNKQLYASGETQLVERVK